MSDPSSGQLRLFCWAIDGVAMSTRDNIVSLRASFDWDRDELRRDLKKAYLPYANTHIGMVGLWKLENPLPIAQFQELVQLDPEDDNSCPHIKRTKLKGGVFLVDEYPHGIGDDQKKIHLVAKRQEKPSPSNSEQPDVGGILARRDSKHGGTLEDMLFSIHHNLIPKATAEPHVLSGPRLRAIKGLTPRLVTITALFEKLNRYFVHVRLPIVRLLGLVGWLVGKREDHDLIPEDTAEPHVLSEARLRAVKRLTPRSATITALFEKLNRYEFVHVHSTPGSGKSSLAVLLFHHIRNMDQNVQILLVNHWIQQEVEPGGWHRYLSNFVNLDGTPYIIFDEGQMTYWDYCLWNDLFKNPRAYVAGAIVFASYGSPGSSSLGMHTNIDLNRAQLVGLSHGHDSNGTGVVGLLFTRDEFDHYIDMRHEPHCFTTDFLQQLFERTNGHIGAIGKLLDIVKHLDIYRKCIHTGSRFDWLMFSESVDPYELVYQIGQDSAFSRGLPHRATLEKPAFAKVFRHILCVDQYIDLPLKALKEAQNHEFPALITCIEKGWIQSEHIWNDHDLMEDQMVYYFASPLHAWYIQMLHGSSLPTVPILHSSILQFCIAVVSHFSPQNIAAPRHINATTIQRPTEAQYQDEFYRCCQAVVPGNITFSEFGARKGRIDFYFPANEWRVGLLRDGDDLRGHASQFSSQGWYAGVFPARENIILDFRRSMPTRTHPSMANLFHVVFGAGCASVQFLDNNLQLVPDSSFSLVNV